MSSTGSSSRRSILLGLCSVGRLSLAVLLLGAPAALAQTTGETRQQQQQQNQNQTRGVIIMSTGGAGGAGQEVRMYRSSAGAGARFLGTDGSGGMRAYRVDGANMSGGYFAGVDGSFMQFGGMGPERLAQFAEDHPSADADGDGLVSNPERQAYLTAQVLSDQDSVLEQFPHADGNGDGLLDTMEAANLVGGRMYFTPAMAGGGDMEMDVSHRVTVNATEDEVGGGEMTIRINGEEIYSGPSPSQWVEQNLVSEITPEDVADMQLAIEAGRSAEFLARNPGADLDGDGFMTGEERAAFLDQRMTEITAVLEGINFAEMTSPEEMRAALQGVMAQLTGEGGLEVAEKEIDPWTKLTEQFIEKHELSKDAAKAAKELCKQTIKLREKVEDLIEEAGKKSGEMKEEAIEARLEELDAEIEKIKQTRLLAGLERIRERDRK